jgi:hypothetical protein
VVAVVVALILLAEGLEVVAEAALGALPDLALLGQLTPEEEVVALRLTQAALVEQGAQVLF